MSLSDLLRQLYGDPCPPMQRLSEESAAAHWERFYRDQRVEAALNYHDSIRRQWWRNGYLRSWWAGVDGLDRSKPRPHWKRPGLGLRCMASDKTARQNGYLEDLFNVYAKPASGIE